MNQQSAIDRFEALYEEDRFLVLQEIRDTRGSGLDRATSGILQLALDLGTSALSSKQRWKLLLEAWVPNVALECSRCGGTLLPEEMVIATLQEGRCCYCDHVWQKILAE